MNSKHSYPKFQKFFRKFEIKKLWDSVLISVLIGAMAFKSLFMFAKLDFDRHHDGIMLAQAMAVNQGFIVHKDVLAQYGPVTPWIHSFFLELDLFGPLLTLRFATTCLIVLTIFLIADMGRVSPTPWRINSWTSRIAAVTWLILCDVWIGTTMLPWSSVVATFFLVFCIYSLALSQRKISENKFISGSSWALLAGLALGLLPFTRLNVGLLSVVLLIFSLVAFSIVNPNSWKKTTKLFCFGFSISFLLVIYLLIRNEAIKDFYYQAIKWPREWAPDAILGWKTQENIFRMFFQQIIPVLVLLLFTFRKNHISRLKSVILSGLISVAIFSWQTWLGIIRVRSKSQEIQFDFHLLGKNIFETYLEFFLVCIGVSFFVIFALFLKKSAINLREGVSEYSGLLIVGLSAVSLESQIVPTWDSRHIWWGMPTGLLLLFSLLNQNKKKFRFVNNPIFFQVFVVAILSLALGLSELKVKREPFIDSSGSIAKGMKLSAHEVAWLAADAEFLRIELGNSKAIFYVWDGYLSVINGKYASVDKYFIDFGEASDLKSRFKNDVPIVVDNVYMNQKLKNEIESYGYKLDVNNKHLFIFRPK